jgi:hydroxymethylglutaryl-CoA lyase
VTRLVAQVREAIAPIPVRVHFHDTRNTAVANVWAAVEAGASVVDAALGGRGGCPFAPGAAGNVATEDVVHLLERSGIATGFDLASLLDASRWLAGVMAKPMPAKLARSGPGPLLEARR